MKISTYVRFATYAFLLCYLTVPIGLTIQGWGDERTANNMAYEALTYDQLVEGRVMLDCELKVVGRPTDHARAVINAEKWQGSASRYVSVNPNDTDHVTRLKVMLESAFIDLQSCTAAYMREYSGSELSKANKGELTKFRQWQDSVAKQYQANPAIGEAWALFFLHLVWCGVLIISTILMEQGVLWKFALRYAAYAMVSLFSIFGAVGGGKLTTAYAQTTETVKAKKQGQNKTSDPATSDDGFNFKLKYLGLELLGSPQPGSGQYEVSPEWLAQFASFRGVKVGGFGFLELRDEAGLTFFLQGVDFSHPQWRGLKFVSAFGSSGANPQASVGIGVSLKSSPVKTLLPGVQYLDVNFYHGFGAAAKNEIVLTGSSNPIPLPKKFRMVLTGFYRIRDLGAITNNYGQLQMQWYHERYKKVAFVYEAETIGDSVRHLFGIKLFLK